MNSGMLSNISIVDVDKLISGISEASFKTKAMKRVLRKLFMPQNSHIANESIIILRFHWSM